MDEFSHEERSVENLRQIGAGNCLHIRRRNVQKVGPKTEEFLIERLGQPSFSACSVYVTRKIGCTYA